MYRILNQEAGNVLVTPLVLQVSITTLLTARKFVYHSKTLWKKSANSVSDNRTECSVLLFILEAQDASLAQDVGNALRDAEMSRRDLSVADSIIFLDRENEEESHDRLCSELSKGVSLIVDLSWSPWEVAQEIARDSGLPILRGQLGPEQLVTALNSYLELRNATDMALIMQSERDVDRALYTLLGKSNIRVWTHAGLNLDATRILKNMKPQPNYYAIVGDTPFIIETYRRAVKEKLARLTLRWNLVFTDYEASNLELSDLILPTVLLSGDPLECCKLLGKSEECTCPSDFDKQHYILTNLIAYVIDTYIKLDKELDEVTARVYCDKIDAVNFNSTQERLFKQFGEEYAINNESVFYWDEERFMMIAMVVGQSWELCFRARSAGLFLKSKFTLAKYKMEPDVQNLAIWSADEDFKLLPGVALDTIRMFFRVGTTPEVRSAISSLTSAIGACNDRIRDLAARVLCSVTIWRLQAFRKKVRRNESSTHLILSVATKLGVSLDERDVVGVERVGMIGRTGLEGLGAPAPVSGAAGAPCAPRPAAGTGPTKAGMGLSSDERRLYAIPWTMPKIDPDTGEPMVNEDGHPVYEGYCIDLIEKISEVLEFDYEIITPKSGTFGRKLPPTALGTASWET
ncbi:hypothetical protein EVAR_41562_1 [Eumeta japonica]|uniref:Ionotropic glutamate receptor L-glutamate and glycine-binding domain-containing protein n=1 Tax=Eumeta variegata TaxID=151549 RepID=A0A4C1Y1G6_EUMVA|nr:hypothetical protein EVAR_41562_1 [Eumeta japonica]